MNSENPTQIAFAMKRYGGSFMQAIGEALLCADDCNISRIKQTWPEEWDNYAAMGRADAEKAKEVAS